jgi:subtilisin family serine protease
LGVLCGLVAVAGAAVRGDASGTREGHFHATRPLKIAKLDSTLLRHRGRVRVELIANRPPQARALVAREGGRVETAYGRLVEALVPAAALRTLAHSDDVRFVGAPVQPIPEEVHGQGVLTTGAAAWHRAGALGAGVKVAVVDIGFDGYRKSQANGDLPRSAVKVDLCPDGGFTATNHGTAVAEIVAEMAPSAKLYLVCAQSVPALGLAVAYARAHGIQIISHSVSWLNTSRGDGKGAPDTPEGIVAAARAAGILWVNAAGNRAEQHWSGSFVDTNANGWHEFAPGDEGNTISVRPGAYVCAALKWDDWAVSAEDYDLYITRSPGGSIVASSTGAQLGAEPPTELVCKINGSGATETYAIAIRASRVTGRPVRFDLFVYPGPNLEHRVPEASVTEPGTSPAALTVGALCWQDSSLEPYSSRGPTIDGRVKPDLVGPDSVSSFAFGTFVSCGGAGGFAGTSASAPHVAGAAALVKQANPAFGPDELQGYLEQRAVDLGVAGKDPEFGSGALALAGAPRLPLRDCIVPRLVGRRLATARSQLARAGCRLGRVRRARSRRRGRVLRQHPRSGTRLAPRSRVSLVVGR